MNLERLFQYDGWANREVVSRLREAGSPESSLRLLNHIVGAQWLWIARLNQEQAKTGVWPAMSLDEIASDLDRLREVWRSVLQRIDATTSIDYRNTKGQPWTSRVEDVLMHVIIHSAYHRGQIATVVRQGGNTPAYTDYIQATRSGAV